MTSPDPLGRLPGIAVDGDLAVVHCADAFQFAPGHRMRAANCLICQRLIGDQPATIVGAAALADNACECGFIVSDVFLIHADHLPMCADHLEAAINRGLQCDHNRM